MNETIEQLKQRAVEVRRNVIKQARGKGEGYVGQGLGSADMLTALYFHEMRYDANKPDWPDRDRFLLSTGHYSIVLWATLTAMGLYPEEMLTTYGADESPFGMSAVANTPGVEVTGGSLSMGLSQAIGMALGARYQEKDFRVFNFMSDGELQEGATWEAAMSASHFMLDNLIVLIDVNGVQADGRMAGIMTIEPIEDKWHAFGWQTTRIDGNDMAALVTALHEARERNGKPKVIICDTLMGKGVPFIEQRDKGHFVRVEADEWELALAELENNA
jgi:transketolase